MPFDYLHSNISRKFVDGLKDRSEETFKAEVMERAKLLSNLGYSLVAATKRITSNVEWEFDDAWTSKLPSFHGKIQDWVGQVYKRLGK